MAVFRKLVAKLMSLQHQLDPTYHTDQVLRDRLMTDVYLPKIQSTLRYRIPRPTHQAVNRIANQLCDKEYSAGSTSPCILEETSNTTQDEELYSLSKTYGGDAKRITKRPWIKKDKYRGTLNTRGFKLLIPNWMKGIKGCFVCGKDHMANYRQPK